MSSFLDEEVPPVNPLSVIALSELGRCFLSQLAPEMLGIPQPLDVLTLVDTKLPEFGINIYPASSVELDGRDGATDPKGKNETTILVSENVWNSLEQTGPQSYYGRSTVCHEIGHAVLHVPLLRKRLTTTNVLSRIRRGSLKAYEDPEWQAWGFAGAILMPTECLNILTKTGNLISPELLSDTFSVSSSMARTHLKRLKWPGFC